MFHDTNIFGFQTGLPIFEFHIESVHITYNSFFETIPYDVVRSCVRAVTRTVLKKARVPKYGIHESKTNVSAEFEYLAFLNMPLLHVGTLRVER